MPARKSATKLRKAKKQPAKKAAKRPARKAVKPAARKAVVRAKAKSSKAPARKAAKRVRTSKPATTKTKRKVVKKTVTARPSKARTAARAASTRKAAAPRRVSRPAQAKAARKPAVKKKAATARPKAAARPDATRGKFPKLVAVAPRIRRPVEVIPVDDEEGFESDFHRNLLLGPRNVQPYVERKGEAYMGKEQLEHFRSILFNWKRDLMEEVDRTMNHMKDEAANPPDPNDRATLESEFALELRTRDRERKLIRKIDEALKRIDDASYGYCLETGEPIGIKRLEARPVATLCIEAQERRERREKQYGDRDDWYR